MVVCEDFDDDYIAMFEGLHELLSAEPVRIAHSAVTGALAEAGLDPEYLSASLVVDAKSFFQARQSS
jgi:hypothetical protein